MSRDFSRGGRMWDEPDEPTRDHLTHDMTCSVCGHGWHTFLPCDECGCPPHSMPGAA